MDIALWANIAVNQSEDLEVAREKGRVGDTTVTWKDIERDVHWRSHGAPETYRRTM